ncbi:hypothetical protein I6M33_07315 [Shewanella algae]|uniref:hypothetical protein n=1 Tax=Shewanella algae TaxID=38313 RepID=UPI001AAC4E5F|nr:hypothetical protein [Shewanella algae]MBO2560431.1 hypothetical protein [Shewanella algae]
MKKITLVVRGDVNVSPTVNNYLTAFVKLGYSVNCICSTVSGGKVASVNYYEVGCGYSSNLFTKFINYFKFGLSTKKIIKNSSLSNSDLFWVSRIDTALCMLSFFKSTSSVLALHEMHDSFPIWKKITKYVIPNYTSIVYNESNRAQIARVFYGLNKLPYVIPNKPSHHPRERNIRIIDDSLSKVIELVKDKFVVIYQGSLQSDRNLMPLVKASKLLGSDFRLVIMGKDVDNRVDEFLSINPDIVYFPWVVPPDHLAITSHCSVGVAFYDTDCLNSIYCAPNKIWEYSGFGIPVLGQNIPGLENTVARFQFGKCVDLDEVELIVSSLIDIRDNYDTYSNNAIKFYDSVDFDILVGSVLEQSLK